MSLKETLAEAMAANHIYPGLGYVAGPKYHEAMDGFTKQLQNKGVLILEQYELAIIEQALELRLKLLAQTPQAHLKDIEYTTELHTKIKGELK